VELQPGSPTPMGAPMLGDSDTRQEDKIP